MGGRRSWLPIVAGIAALGGVGWLLSAGSRGVEVATVLGLPIALASLLMSGTGRGLLSRRNVESGDSALRDQARLIDQRVWTSEVGELQHLLAPLADRDGDPLGAPFGVRWRRLPDGHSGRAVTTAPAVDALLEFHRVAVVGPAGAGKSVLVMQYVCRLAERGWKGNGDGGAAQPVLVPVRANLSEFQPLRDDESSVADVSAEKLYDRLDDWLTRRVAGLGVPAETARRLVTLGWVVPVLDGLDEMDRPGTARPRATAVLAALNRHTAAHGGLRRVVLTSRIDAYRQLAGLVPATDDSHDAATASASGAGSSAGHGHRANNGAGAGSWLAGADEIELLSLTPTDVARELRRRFPRRDGPWQPVRRHLTSAADGDPVVAALCSPLGLYLAVTAYRGSRADPGELLTLDTAGRVNDRLFQRLVPQLVAPGIGYRPPEVERWLITMARHLDGGGRWRYPTTDFAMTAIPALQAPRIARFACTGAMLLLTVLGLDMAVQLLGAEFSSAVAFGPLVAIWAWVSYPLPAGHRLDVSALRRRAALRRLAWAVVQAILLFGCIAILIGLTRAIVGGHAERWLETAFEGAQSGAILGVALGIWWGLDLDPPASGARRYVHQGIAYVATLLPLCAILGAAIGAWIGGVGALRAGIVLGLGVGLVVLSGSVWPGYAVSAVMRALAGQRRAFPSRPARFLDWAHGAGLLRAAGTSLQFRHKEFQDWLATRPPV
jgi:hypothetical protein